MTRHRLPIGFLVLSLAILVFPMSITAHHRWARYHWQRAVNPLTLVVSENLSSGWVTYFNQAVNDWNASTVLSLSTASGTKDPVSCFPTLGRIEVCNAAYGNNGWLGLAQIWTTSGSHIAQAITKVNDTYFNTAQYNTSAWRRLVMCQEVGHDFGLDHQDEIFDNTNLGTCMDYTNDPDGTIYGQLSNVSPNAHDYEELLNIYKHLDGTGGGGGGRGQGASGAMPPQAALHVPDNDQRSWGRLVASNGRVAHFVLDLGGGNQIHTFVIFA
jgi:hypothetical protein